MKRFMNVLFTLSAAAIISLAFTGCGEKVEQPAKTEPTSVEQPKQAEQPAKTEPSSVEQPKQAEQPAKTEHPSGEHPQ